MTDFTPIRSLLNPKFEGYKLLLLDQDHVARHTLPYKTTQASSYGKTPLIFQEVQSRITHNHFVLSPAKGRGLYVDANHRVIVVDIGDVTTDPSFTAVYELPTPVAAPQIDLVHPEYPSAAFLNETVVFIGDGWGNLFVLDIPIVGPATLLANFDLVDKDSVAPRLSVPFRVHNVIRISEATAVALLSSRYYGTAPDLSAKNLRKGHEFDVWAARFTLPFEVQLESPALDIVWRRRGEDVPMLMTYRTKGAYMLLGSSTYRKTSDPHVAQYDPSPDEMASIPRPEENLDVQGPLQPTKPHPYSWTQTSDVVTVAFPLPSIVNASQIKVTFSPKTLTVHVTTPSPISVEDFAIPRYSAKQLWASIRSSTSFWTWDREGEHEFGILAVHLDKQDEGTKWSYVFAASGTWSAEADDVDVPETLDPSELYTIREALEKYTSALREGEDASGLGLGRGLPTLAQGEMDEEVDSSVGRLAFVTWVGDDGSSPAWSAAYQQWDSAFNILSTPLPGTEMAPLSLVVKNGFDGTRHVLLDEQGGLPEWKHENTFSALAFVLASKRDTRFTYHASDVVFAFENGAQDRGGNVYLYRSCSPNELWARQSVLTVGRAEGGSLLGVGAFASDEKSGNTIVCLCENELVILRNVR